MVIIKSGQNTHFTASQTYANIDFTHIKKSFLIKMNIKQYKYWWAKPFLFIYQQAISRLRIAWFREFLIIP